MKAIFTKYHGPTNYKGSRISASDDDGNRVTISYPYELSGEAVHRAAADALLKKMSWDGEIVGGWHKHGMVFCFVENREKELAEAVIKWAKEPRSHGQNPHTLGFVELAEEIINKQ